MKITQRVCYFVISHEFYQICAFFADIKKFIISLESAFFNKMSQMQNFRRVGHGKSRNSHGNYFCQVCGNPDIGKTFVRSV